MLYIFLKLIELIKFINKKKYFNKIKKKKNIK